MPADAITDSRVTTQGVEIGAGWTRKGETSVKDCVSLLAADPEFGQKRLYANLGRAAGADDSKLNTAIWHPLTKTKAPAQVFARGQLRSFAGYVLALSNSAATFFQLSPLPVPPRSV